MIKKIVHKFTIYYVASSVDDDDEDNNILH